MTEGAVPVGVVVHVAGPHAAQACSRCGTVLEMAPWPAVRWWAPGALIAVEHHTSGAVNKWVCTDGFLLPPSARECDPASVPQVVTVLLAVTQETETVMGVYGSRERTERERDRNMPVLEAGAYEIREFEVEV